MARCFGLMRIGEKLLPQIEQLVTKTLHVWSSRESIEVKLAAATMLLGFTLKQMFGFDSEKSAEDLSEKVVDFVHGLMSLPLNIPGATYHKCLKDQKEVLNMMRGIVKERLTFPEKYRGDFLDHAIEDMKTKECLTEDFIVQLMLGILFASFEPISAVLAEHEEILQNRENADSPLSWDEYKLMTFTLHVIHEVLRLGNVGPGLFRRATKISNSMLSWKLSYKLTSSYAHSGIHVPSKGQRFRILIA
ncbi:hypothetical protein Acr_09g0009520 [Actinidia rufa]|uniref:Uncharacterized protein n=1 Tax=Actinidia rufa TaxID=165716 RepID=A0A7J0F7W5_9ERIC|nr:hypothetical protein Acr_09g0009520 [Actinidia rufa]